MQEVIVFGKKKLFVIHDYKTESLIICDLNNVNVF